jgi:hypothetical protein
MSVDRRLQLAQGKAAVKVPGNDGKELQRAWISQSATRHTPTRRWVARNAISAWVRTRWGLQSLVKMDPDWEKQKEVKSAATRKDFKLN